MMYLANMTSFPNGEKSYSVSLTMRPVTQTADVEVKRASIGVHLSALDEKGERERRRVPTSIRLKYPNTRTLAGVS